MRMTSLTTLLGCGLLTCGATAQTFYFVGADGLSAEAEFTLINPTTLEVRLKNTSTGVPSGFSNSDQLLTGVSWDFGAPGQGIGDNTITGGSVVIGPSSASVDFDTGSYGAGTDVSGEFAYGNMDGTGLLENFFSTNTAQATPFGGANLDGPVNIDGPQPGLISNAFSLPLGGLGAIRDEVIATLTLSQALADTSFLQNGVRVEFGSDAYFITVPAPTSAALLGLAGLVGARRRR
ncbi:MAG: XDD4 family exosortase-dependent surface protein [Phycisphaerales bacterium JB040]